MDNSFYNMELKQFKELFTDKQQIALGDDFCIVDAHYNQKLQEFQYPVRLDAYMVLFCIEGRVRFSVNMKEFTMEKDQMALLIPGYIGQVVDIDLSHKEDLHFVMVGVSRRFLSTLNLDLNRVFNEVTLLLDTPCIRLTEEEKGIAMRYLELAAIVLHADLPNKHDCIGSLISSLFYLSEGVFDARLKMARDGRQVRVTRAEDVLNKFLRLLAEYHTRERSVGFYADKLCLSPKYFSKLIKSASGRTAPEWIDDYVVMEAKNYLKYSDMTIKQIVARLNFSDQPTFTKFFKAHTGMTPAQFRKN